ncbi:MAG: hypothetical protein ACTSU2_07405 [Promethearchaeota archaeon]
MKFAQRNLENKGRQSFAIEINYNRQRGKIFNPFSKGKKGLYQRSSCNNVKYYAITIIFIILLSPIISPLSQLIFGNLSNTALINTGTNGSNNKGAGTGADLLDGLKASNINATQWHYNPQDTQEGINPVEYRGVTNNEFKYYGHKNEKLDDIYDFNEDVTPEGYTVMDSSNKVSGNYSVKLYSYDYSTYNKYIYIDHFLDTSKNIINNNASISFNWYLENLSSFIYDSFYMLLNLNNSQMIGYYFGGDYQYNTSGQAMYLVDHYNDTGAWYFCARNITQDYLARFGSFSSIVAIRSIYIYIVQDQYAGCPSVGYIDNVTLLIDMQSTLNNGDFESESIYDKIPTGWGSMYNYPGSIKDVNVAHNDGHVLNFTAEVKNPYSNRYMYSAANLNYYGAFNNPSYEISENHSIILNFTYYIGSTGWSQNNNGRFYLNIYNGSQNIYLNFYTFTNDQSVLANSSDNLNILLPNSTGTWHHQEINLIDLLESHFGANYKGYIISNFILLSIATTSGDDMAWMLVDDFDLKMDMIYNGNFEKQAVPDNSIMGWRTNGGVLHTNTSDNSVEGQYSANIEYQGSVNDYVYQDYLDKEIFNNTLISFAYNVQAFNGDQINDIIYISFLLIELNSSSPSGKMINYILASGASVGEIANSSNNVYYYVQNFNKTNNWYFIRRSLYWDAAAAFSDFTQMPYSLFGIFIYLQNTHSSESIGLLLDDIKVGTNIPYCEELTQSPIEAEYNKDLDITADIFDSSSSYTQVTLYYNLDYNGTGSQWKSAKMSLNDASLQVYNFTIGSSEIEYGHKIAYYIEMTSLYGDSAMYPNGGISSPIVIDVYDKISPILSNVVILEGVLREGRHATFSINVSDEASGIKQVIFYYKINEDGNWTNSSMKAVESSVVNNSGAIMSATFEATISGPPVYSILYYYVVATDNAGMNASTLALNNTGVTVARPRYSTLETFLIGMGTMAGVVLGAFIGTKIYQVKKKKSKAQGARNPNETLKADNTKADKLMKNKGK